jgi:hypothetical protein
LNTLAIHFLSLRICFDSLRSKVRQSKSQTLLPGPHTRVKTLQAAWTRRSEKRYEGADATIRIEGAFHDNIIDTQTTILLQLLFRLARSNQDLLPFILYSLRLSSCDAVTFTYETSEVTRRTNISKALSLHPCHCWKSLERHEVVVSTRSFLSVQSEPYKKPIIPNTKHHSPRNVIAPTTCPIYPCPCVS